MNYLAHYKFNKYLKHLKKSYNIETNLFSQNSFSQIYPKQLIEIGTGFDTLSVNDYLKILEHEEEHLNFALNNKISIKNANIFNFIEDTRINTKINAKITALKIANEMSKYIFNENEKQKIKLLNQATTILLYDTEQQKKIFETLKNFKFIKNDLSLEDYINNFKDYIKKQNQENYDKCYKMFTDKMKKEGKAGDGHSAKEQGFARINENYLKKFKQIFSRLYIKNEQQIQTDNRLSGKNLSRHFIEKTPVLSSLRPLSLKKEIKNINKQSKTLFILDGSGSMRTEFKEEKSFYFIDLLVTVLYSLYEYIDFEAVYKNEYKEKFFTSKQINKRFLQSFEAQGDEEFDKLSINTNAYNKIVCFTDTDISENEANKIIEIMKPKKHLLINVANRVYNKNLQQLRMINIYKNKINACKQLKSFLEA